MKGDPGNNGTEGPPVSTSKTNNNVQFLFIRVLEDSPVKREIQELLEREVLSENQ